MMNFFKKSANSSIEHMDLKKVKEEDRKVTEFKQIMKSITPIEDDPEFLNLDITAQRFLRSRDFDMKNAEKLLREDVDWRKQKKPRSVSCGLCLQKPGAHSMRQIGFDLYQRPVIYSSFTQASVAKVEIADVIDHMIYVLENCIRTMILGVHQWVLIFDCSGMSIQSCNFRLGTDCMKILSDHYPERLAYCLCIRPGSAFKTALNAIKKAIPAATAKKLVMVKFNEESAFETEMKKYFDDEMIQWLKVEVRLNKKSLIGPGQKNFWKVNEEESHDPRGYEYYVTNYINKPHSCEHKPHPNILQDLKGEELVWQRDGSTPEVDEEQEEES